MKDMTGSIKRNKNKLKPSHADASGSCMLEGREYWINCWLQETPDADGKVERWTKLLFKPKTSTEAQASAATAPVRRPNADDIDDDIPF